MLGHTLGSPRLPRLYRPIILCAELSLNEPTAAADRKKHVEIEWRTVDKYEISRNHTIIFLAFHMFPFQPAHNAALLSIIQREITGLSEQLKDFRYVKREA